MIYFAKLNGMSDLEADQAVNKITSELEMSDYIDRPVGKYSRGMKQKYHWQEVSFINQM